MPQFRQAPPLRAAMWFDVTEPPTLEALRGSVVLLHAFQMRCPAWHELATPQARRVHASFSGRDIAVIGLHCVSMKRLGHVPDLEVGAALGALLAESH